MNDDDVRSEYELNYREGRPNRFAEKLHKGGRLIVLEPEVAAVFKDSEEVNAVLRAIVNALPTPPQVQ